MQATMPSMTLPTHPQHYQPFVVFAVKEPSTFDDWDRFIKEASALGVEMRVTIRENLKHEFFVIMNNN